MKGRPTNEQYRMRPGCRLSHPVYGTGTYLHGRLVGAISTIAVEWDRKPVWTRPGAFAKRCGVDLADCTPILKSARFWTWENGGWVRVELTAKRPKLTHHWRRRTDEGWDGAATTWTLTPEGVEREWWSGGRDCDGYLESAGEDFCPHAELASSVCKEDGQRIPAWAEKGYRVRDAQAEAAGY